MRRMVWQAGVCGVCTMPRQVQNQIGDIMEAQNWYWQITHDASGAIINSGFAASKPNADSTPEGYTMTVTQVAKTQEKV